MHPYEFIPFAVQVLGAMVDNILPFDDATFPLIRDALFVLASKVCTLLLALGNTCLRMYVPLNPLINIFLFNNIHTCE